MVIYKTAGSLKSPEYEELWQVTRSIHLEEFKECYAQKKLMGRSIISSIRATGVFGKVIWFGPDYDKHKHNWYGNVSFTISLEELLFIFGSRLHYIDRQDYPTHCCTRVVLDSRILATSEMNISDPLAPLKCVSGRWYVASRCDSTYGTVPHELEIGVRVKSEDCVYLYDHCFKTGNNHIDCNNYKPHRCHRHNTFQRICPTPYSKIQTDFMLRFAYNIMC